MTMRTLPQRRPAETVQLRFWNQSATVTVGYYGDGSPGEIFIDAGKSGQDVQSTARDAAIVLSLALQHGVTVDTIQRAITRLGDGSASSILGVAVDRLSALVNDVPSNIGGQC
jgi:ribonucleoside-diphosphate reductase alpha chain